MTQASYEPARLELARLRIDSPEAYEQAVRRATELSARTLGVERVGVWLFDPEQPEVLRLEHLYVRSASTHTEGDELLVAKAHRYRAALREKKAIVADDARTDAVTADLRASYLEPLGITSMLDAPLYVHGEVVGVICHEHVGPPRKWTAAEVDFACTIADTASLICEQARRLGAERELRERVARASAGEPLEAVARLSRGLAHELSNVFAASRLATDQLARQGEPASRELAMAIGEALRVGERLLADLRRFGERASVNGAAGARTRAAEVMRRFRPILEVLVRPQAELAVEVDPALALELDDTALEQVVLNLVLNARDALAGSGKIGVIGVEIKREGAGALVSVTDDGPGIPEELRSRIGREYFTTKAHGTGLGLSVASDLATAVGGRLDVVRVDRGARIELHLPTRECTAPV